MIPVPSPLLLPRPPALGGIRQSLRRVVAARPAVYLPLRACRRPGTVLDARTDLVIEGAPRCGNTWAEFALRRCRPDLRLAHHSHAAAHVKRALSRDIPVLVVIRDPDAAVASRLAMGTGAVTVRGAFLDYAAFYEALASWRGPGLLVADFAAVTRAMSRVVAALEARFALDLPPFDDACPATRAAVLAAMDAHARAAGLARGAASRSNPLGHDAAHGARLRAARAAIAAPGAARARARAQAARAAFGADIAGA